MSPRWSSQQPSPGPDACSAALAVAGPPLRRANRGPCKAGRTNGAKLQETSVDQSISESLTAAGIDGTPRKLLADAGYISANQVDAVTDAGINPLLASGRLKHGQQFHGRWSHLALSWAQHRLTCAGSWICGSRSRAGSVGSSRCSPISTARRLPL